MTGDAPAAGGAVLDVAGLRVGFAGVGEVLHGVDLTIAAGECVAVVGESGAGKSVLARAVVGLAAEGGSVATVSADRFRLRGRDALRFRGRDWRSARGRDVGLVLQDALQSLDPLRTVGAEVGEALAVHTRSIGAGAADTVPGAADAGPGGARSAGGAPGRLPTRALRRERVLGALTAAGLDDPELRAAQRPGELSGGMRQRALIASAIVTGPPLLVADEPTTALDATVAVHVLDLLARLRDAGTALLLVSHDLAAVARVADRVLVLRDGVVVEQGPTALLLGAPQHPATRALLAAVPRGPKRWQRQRPAAGTPAGQPGQPGTAGVSGPAFGPVVLASRGLRRVFPLPGGGEVHAVAGVDLDLRRGEAIGVVGESGSGKTTLARLLLAAERPDAGEVTLDGEPWSGATERERRQRRRRIRFVPQDPLGSFDPRHTAGRLLTEALRPGGGTPTPAELLARVRLPEETLARRPRSLSGGQRQRLAIARALATGPEVLVCDEPVSALDVTVQAGILDLLVELQRTQGLAIVLVSHDLAVIRRVCDTVLVMRAGTVVERGDVEQVFAHPADPFTRELLAARAW